MEKKLNSIQVDGEEYSLSVNSINVDGLADVARTGSYNDLADKPTIPTDTAELNNGAGFITSEGLAANVTGTVAMANGGTGAKTAEAARTNLGLGAAATKNVASSIASGSGDLVTGGVVYEALQDKSDKSDLAAVATSGSYNDLSNTPSIPSKTSELTNDSDFLSGTVAIAKGGTGATSASGARTNLGLTEAATASVTKAVTQNDDSLVTSGAVFTAISSLPEPMVFKGSLGTSGTVTSLPAAAKANTGFVYKVITDGTYQKIAAKVGDAFISDGTTWVLIPSGDEPSGTVTSVTISATSPISIDNSAAITSSGSRIISHAESGATAGSYGDSANQSPAYGGTFKVPYVTVNATGHVTGISEHTVKIPASDNTNTTYTFAEGTTNGAFSVTPSGGAATSIKIHGLGSNAYTSTTIPTGAAASKGVDTSIAAASTSANLPTSAAVAAFVEGKGYKAGTVTSVKVQGSNGISGSGTITSSGTVTLTNSGVRSITQDSTNKSILKINTNGVETSVTLPNTTYSAATSSAAGLMSAADKAKLDMFQIVE